jgi:hypothetical protein
MDQVTVIIETLTEDGIEQDIVAVCPIHEEDFWMEALQEEDAELESREVPSSEPDYEDGERVYVLVVLDEGEILSALFVTSDEEEAEEMQAELSESRQEEVQVLETSFCCEGS